ncbi:hypothetical protein A1O7_01818 [Cladophialophora yegresii CBS 114405]|uniref:Cyclase n=1 Tax=Cladophialophora yegresii CBS 114405 TaxID=1182544 RepID=W9WBI6_9EURO|nr:uncharacterized protein A1O7_01818 [Cladophialophora yegresii CBS 114405]EXJ65477.1 hypothetical protein A1O7_01818 [Cladophialophora yegresii CBS 114405]
MAEYKNLPDFDSLPTVEGVPHCSWGLFDKDGKKDVLGCINLLTPEVVKEAYKEARDGVSISLNWPLGALAQPGFARKGIEHKPFNAFKDHGIHCFDDEIAFNTQSSSQWDGLVHFAHQGSGLNYNGAKATEENLLQHFGESDTEKTLPSLNHWLDRGGLVGRGILLDYKEYAAAKGIKYSPFENHTITIEDLEAVAKHQGTEFKFGDILLVRTGFTDDLGSASAEEQAQLLSTHQAVGVAGCKATACWVWNHHFAGVASDNIGFEVCPPAIEEENNRVGSLAELVLHQYFLSGFGLNIGELWDRKALGEHCKKVGRYEFLLSSCPLNVWGSVASPPNALAMF